MHIRVDSTRESTPGYAPPLAIISFSNLASVLFVGTVFRDVSVRISFTKIHSTKSGRAVVSAAHKHGRGSSRRIISGRRSAFADVGSVPFFGGGASFSIGAFEGSGRY